MNNTLEVLLSCMHQENLDFIKSQNIYTDVLVINQSNTQAYSETRIDSQHIRMIVNESRGLSRSRNEALLHAKGDICLIADDDIRYADGYDAVVKQAFAALPDADIIIFNITRENHPSASNIKPFSKIRRAPKHKTYGSVRIAFRLQSVQKHNLWFNLYFGAGSLFACGEESLFILDAHRKGLRIYEYPKTLCTVNYSSSTWFSGYNHEFFYNKGAWLEAAYPNRFWMYRWYYVFRLKKHTSLTFSEILECMKQGKRGYRRLKPYEAMKPNKG